MPDFAVSTAFTARDRVTGAFRLMGRGATRFGGNASRAFRTASRQGSLFGKIVKGILVAGVIRKGFTLLTSGIREATTQFISFDDAIKSTTARFADLKVNSLAGQRAIADLRKTARNLGAETEFTATEAAQGLEFLALAGFNAKQSIAALPTTINFATAANSDLARAVDIGTDAVGAFGLRTKDYVQLQKNFTRVMDLMAATTSSSNTNIETLFESIQSGAPTFVKSGQSIETFAALTGKLADSGTKGEKAGTALRNIMLRLANPSKEAASELGFLNIAVADQKGNFRDAIDIIGDFERKLKTMGTQEKAATLDIIFGKKAITSFNILLEEGSISLRSFRDDLIDTNGAAARMAEIMRGSLGKRLAALKSAAIEVGFKFLEAFKTRGAGAIDKLTVALRGFDVTPVIEMAKGAVEIFKDLFDTISPVTDLIFSLNKTEVKGILLLGGAIKVVAGSIGLLNAALATNPLALALIGAVGLGAAGVALQKKLSISSPRITVFEELAFDRAQAKKRAAKVTPPNDQDFFRSLQEVNLLGQINLAGAPEGSTFEFLNAPGIKTNVLGPNP
ncbi:phage tail tape measure protein [bacterium]|nr:phage tail tape measure protein [bacterium]